MNEAGKTRSYTDLRVLRTYDGKNHQIQSEVKS